MKLIHNSTNTPLKITLTASKSESNRALIIKSCSASDMEINNLAIADDTKTLDTCLNNFENLKTIDVGPAGTTMRFLTAYLANQSGEWIITGSERMKERPIGILVDALREMGANIEYLEKEGYPPMKITGNPLNGEKIIMDGGVSSQFISAILLIAPSLSKGLILQLDKKVTSRSYLNMTLKIIEACGAQYNWEGNSITIPAQNYSSQSFTVEADWSSASYWYEIAALLDQPDITLFGLKEQSLQGDFACVDIFSKLGVKTSFIEGGVHLSKGEIQGNISLHMENCPDIAQTVICTAAALGVEAKITGLHTLRIKETDRTLALQNELKKFGVQLDIISDDEIFLSGNQKLNAASDEIKTYHDHRMAMSFAPLVIKTASIKIEKPEVVTKSYPEFWNDLAQIGIVSAD